MHIYKYVQSHIILHQHFAVTTVTIIRRSHKTIQSLYQ